MAFKKNNFEKGKNTKSQKSTSDTSEKRVSKPFNKEEKTFTKDFNKKKFVSKESGSFNKDTNKSRENGEKQFSPRAEKPFNKEMKGKYPPKSNKPFDKNYRDNKAKMYEEKNEYKRDNTGVGNIIRINKERDSKERINTETKRELEDLNYSRAKRGMAPLSGIAEGDFDENEPLQLEGRNSVLEALKNDNPIDKIYLKKNEKGEIEGILKVILAKAKEKGIIIAESTRIKLDEMSQTGNHQGVIAICPAKEYVEISDILEIAKSKNEDPFIIILDSVTDPHNLGAVMRTAEACGAHGIIIPKRRSVGLTGAVSKTSAGAIEYVPVARVTNISNAIEELKAAGLWIACADMNGEACYKTKLVGSIALIVGSEGKGVSRLIREKSDFIVSIPMFGQITSLNASVAASVLMYEVVRQRKFL